MTTWFVVIALDLRREKRFCWGYEFCEGEAKATEAANWWLQFEDTEVYVQRRDP